MLDFDPAGLKPGTYMDGVLLDTSRQWPVSKGDIHPGHKARYEFAKRYAIGRVLDAACGCGYGSSLLQEVTAKVVGVDNYPRAIEWAEKFHKGPEFILGNIEDIPWDGVFDLVVSLETIEHLKDPKPVLRVLRKACEGTFIVSTPNEERYQFKAEVFAEDASPHYRHYTPAEFDRLLTEAGFTVVERHCQVGKTEEVTPGIGGMFLVYVCH